jgi:hypothetical protein
MSTNSIFWMMTCLQSKKITVIRKGDETNYNKSAGGKERGQRIFFAPYKEQNPISGII